MPGIVGLITNLPRATAESQLHRMLESICHEPFYVSGTWINSTQGVYVGWVARRGAFADCMPVQNESGEITLVFSGEEFSESSTIASLRDRGLAIPSNRASYLAHCYEEEADFPKGLNGRFHGLTVDHVRGKVMLFNDRFGLQRVYYHEAKDAFYFGAEAKAILKVRPELRSADPRGMGEFLACGCVLENRTLFTGIHVLPPGSAWVFRNGLLEKKAAYFKPAEWEEQEQLDTEKYYSDLRDAFVRALPRYFKGPERIAVSLTGGLDTRIIMAWCNARPGSLPCYTFGSMYRTNEDVRLARKVANLCGQSHQVITTGKDFLSRFAHYAERSVYLSDACIDLGRSPDLYVNEKVREIAPVRIVGTFGSEMLLHAVMFKAAAPATGLFHQDLLPHLENAKSTYESTLQGHPVTFVAFRQSPWHNYGVIGLEQTQVAIRSPYLDNDVIKTIYKAPSSVAANEQGRLRLIQQGNPALAKLRTDRGIGHTNGALTHWILEFLFKAEYAYDYGMPQWVAQIDHKFKALHFERLWLGRHKVFHFRLWYRDELANYVREMLLDPRSLARPYVVPKMVRSIVNGHIKGNRNYTTEIHRLITLELANRLFLES